jgi:hypothetical protein
MATSAMSPMIAAQDETTAGEKVQGTHAKIEPVEHAISGG